MTRILWPALLLLVLLLVFVREAHRRGGTWAAVLALVFAMTSITAIVQFNPGRIDHHNAMILCTVGGLLFLERSLIDARAAGTAGVLLGGALVIGYEPIALILPAIAIAAFGGVWTGSAIAAARATTAAAVTMFLALVATVRWSQWMPVHCDALALNLPLACACCAAGLWLSRGSRHGRIGRMAIAVASTCVAVAVFAALEPACLRGPFAQVSPDVRRIWLDHVVETRSVFAIIQTDPVLGWSFIMFAAAGAFVQVIESTPSIRPDIRRCRGRLGSGVAARLLAGEAHAVRELARRHVACRIRRAARRVPPILRVEDTLHGGFPSEPGDVDARAHRGTWHRSSGSSPAGPERCGCRRAMPGIAKPRAALTARARTRRRRHRVGALHRRDNQTPCGGGSVNIGSTREFSRTRSILTAATGRSGPRDSETRRELHRVVPGLLKAGARPSNSSCRTRW